MRLVGLGAFLALAWTEPGLCQASVGTELWRLAAVTIPLPPALAVGAAAAYWNPAQPDGKGQIGVDLIQTPQAVGATGIVAAVQVPVSRFGQVGFLYARMGLGNLVHTTDSPTPDGAAIPFYSQSAGLIWSRGFAGGRSTLGATATYRDTRFDRVTIDRWSLDFGFTQRVGDRLRLAAATRGFRRLGSDAAQDLSAGLEYRAWRGMLWHNAPGALLVRYGIGTGRPGGVDHQGGLGLDIGRGAPVAVDFVLAREASYGAVAWRGAAGARVVVGRYRVTFARDAGISDLGSSYRVGLEARLD